MEQSTTTTALADSVANDMLKGAPAIAAFIGKTERVTQTLLDRKLLPAFMLGSRWHMRKSTYLAFIERMEAKALSSVAA